MRKCENLDCKLLIFSLKYVLLPSMIVERVGKIKKPKSVVPGDIPPKLVPSIIAKLSVPLADIYNSALLTDWPRLWKREYQTIIPKKPSPTSLHECRNLSCTNLFSKVLESFVLEDLIDEVKVSETQYGGLRGCGTNHFLLQMWQNILEGLEDDNTAIALMSIDFSKAFNRMGHQACLAALAKGGCSNQSLRLIYNFLDGREMCIKDGQDLSNTREVRGGSPREQNWAIFYSA